MAKGKTRRKQNKAHSGFGSLTWVGREARWVVKGHAKRPDGTTARPRLHTFPPEVRSREQADAAFGVWIEQQRTEKAAHLRLPALDVRALCKAFIERGIDVYRKGDKIATHWGLDKSTAIQWAEMQGDVRLADYDGDHFRAFQRALDAIAAAPRKAGAKHRLSTREGVNKKRKAAMRIAKWGVGCKLCAPALVDILKSVKGLGKGEGKAADGAGRQACTLEQYDGTYPHLPEYGQDAIHLIRWSGARPSEVLTLTRAELERFEYDGVWIYRAEKAEHKNAGKGKDRSVYFAPPATEVIDRLIATTTPSDPFLFSQTRIAASEFGLLRKPATGAALTAEHLAEWVKHAAETGEVEHWTPYQLCHMRETEIAAAKGVEVAQAARNHSHATMTANYISGAIGKRRHDMQAEAAMVGAGE